MTARARTYAEAEDLARSLAESDALTFFRRGWEMPDDWPLEDRHARKLLDPEAPMCRSRAMKMMRAAGTSRWRELRRELPQIGAELERLLAGRRMRFLRA